MHWKIRAANRFVGCRWGRLSNLLSRLDSAVSKRAAQLVSGLNRLEIHFSHLEVRRKIIQSYEGDCVLQSSQRPRIFPVFCPAIPRIWALSS